MVYLAGLLILVCVSVLNAIFIILTDRMDWAAKYVAPVTEEGAKMLVVLLGCQWVFLVALLLVEAWQTVVMLASASMPFIGVPRVVVRRAWLGRLAASVMHITTVALLSCTGWVGLPLAVLIHHFYNSRAIRVRLL